MATKVQGIKNHETSFFPSKYNVLTCIARIYKAISMIKSSYSLYIINVQPSKIGALKNSVVRMCVTKAATT